MIGFLAGTICFLAVALRSQMGWDDALDVWAAHGVGGLLGGIPLGVFAYLSVNAAGAGGLVAGNAAFSGKQSRRRVPCSGVRLRCDLADPEGAEPL